MDEVLVDDIFAQFEAQTAGTFRPAPLGEVHARAGHRRRVRRAALACLLATLIVAPAGALAVSARRQDRPLPPLPAVTSSPAASPTPSPTAGETVRPVRRRAVLPKVDLPLRSIWVGPDAQHAWALFESCPGDYGTCRYALGSTKDAGVSWQSARLPDLAADRAAVNVYPLDARTLSIHVVGKRFWLTTDGGATFTAYPVGAPPRAARLANTYPVPGSPFTLLCAGAIGFEDGAGGIECDRRQLVRIGVGAVRPQPTLAGDLYMTIRGRDGRLWLTSMETNRDAQVIRTRLAVSADDARTWTELGSVPGDANLTVSPDGGDVWLVSGYPSGLWRISGTAIVAVPGLPEQVASYRVKALGGGLLAVGPENSAPGFWRDGVFTPLAGVQPSGVDVLPDGSVVFDQEGGGRLIGVGVGTRRTWVQLS